MSILNKKKYKVTFNRPIAEISGTCISEESVTAIKLPEAITGLTSDAFAGCENLQIVEIDKKYKKEEGSDIINIQIAGKDIELDIEPISGTTF